MRDVQDPGRCCKFIISVGAAQVRASARVRHHSCLAELHRVGQAGEDMPGKTTA